MADSSVISKSYPLVAIAMVSAGQDVTVEGFKAMFECLGLECSPKIAEMYASISKDRYHSIFTSVGSAPAVQGTAGASAAADTKAEEVQESEDESDDYEIDF